MKDITNAFIARLSSFNHLHDLKHLFLQPVQNKMPSKLAHHKVKMEFGAKRGVRSCCLLFVYCFSASSSIKAVAHLLIRAEAPANYSDEKEEGGKKKKKIKTALAKRQSEAS